MLPYFSLSSAKQSIIIVTLIFTAAIIFLQTLPFRQGSPKSHMYCFFKTAKSLSEIPPELPSNKSIFFIDTSCRSYSKKRITLHVRQQCVIEAAASLHPDWDVYVLFTAPAVVKLDSDTNKDKILGEVLSYKNVKFHHIDYRKYLRDTPMEALASHPNLTNSRDCLIHANEMLRIVTLWKYGGIFLNLNMLTLKNLESLGRNFVGRDAANNLDNRVLGLSNDTAGTELAFLIMQEMKQNYEQKLLFIDTIGIEALTRALQKTCENTIFDATKERNCASFKVYPIKAFNPIRLEYWCDLFDPGMLNSTLELIAKSYTMAQMEVNCNPRVSTETAYGKLVERLCPKVYVASGGVFH